MDADLKCLRDARELGRSACRAPCGTEWSRRVYPGGEGPGGEAVWLSERLLPPATAGEGAATASAALRLTRCSRMLPAGGLAMPHLSPGLAMPHLSPGLAMPYLSPGLVMPYPGPGRPCNEVGTESVHEH